MLPPNTTMPSPRPAIDETDFFQFIESGARRLSPRQVQQLVSDLPETGTEFSKMRQSDFPETESQLCFLAALVEAVWTELYREISYGAALEAAFAISYFQRAEDLIPDSIEGIGLVDDAAIVATVFARNASEFAKFAEATKRVWPWPRPN
jgi:uncharacterized membrane protein YkvA (DUF1232 family)